MSDYPNARDCEHGHQRGQCERCDDAEELRLLREELATALAILANARDTLAVWAAADGDDGPAWMRTLRDNLDGYLRRHP